MIPLDTHTFKHETHLPICFIKATEETRQLDLKPSKDYCPLSISNQGTKKNQVDETFRTFDIPDQCDLERIKAGYHSNDVLCIRFPSRNELVVKVWTNKNVKSF
ncbi:uncharacterized protein LOC111643666 isoform X1 [Copidosoma floridanum]|uniref:uncharacterized protein LOC111643666 isoform X1 n=1 Tax=Copidosoma floridanum TaxID=29053 RepID=UPI000C6FC35C|nr:uncharacterized protein LOC111643666 isoform X1 [Copidosoma floridanum]